MEGACRRRYRTYTYVTRPFELSSWRVAPSETTTHPNPECACSAAMQPGLVGLGLLLLTDPFYGVVLIATLVRRVSAFLVDHDDRGTVDLTIAGDFLVAVVAGVKVELEATDLHHMPRQRCNVPPHGRLPHVQNLVGLDPWGAVMDLYDLGV